jgi:hypothetical protein
VISGLTVTAPTTCPHEDVPPPFLKCIEIDGVVSSFSARQQRTRLDSSITKRRLHVHDRTGACLNVLNMTPMWQPVRSADSPRVVTDKPFDSYPGHPEVPQSRRRTVQINKYDALRFTLIPA